MKTDDYGFRNPNQQRPIFSDRNFLWVDELNFIFQGTPPFVFSCPSQNREGNDKRSKQTPTK